MRPYPFQRQVAQLLLDGHNVILQAPTGGGKTFAALLPFLHAIEHKRDFPPKCIYAVPMRVLANQFLDDFRDRIAQAGRNDLIQVAIQTGERAEDPKFAATLTFATIDQVLSSFLLAPYSLPRRLSNLNAGAVAASYLVFDEFHLFDPISTLPTTLEMLRMLDGVAPFLLMTATFSRPMLSALATALNAVVVPENDAALQAMQDLPCQQKTRLYHVVEEPLTAGAILSRHRKRTLVVCNVVNRARVLFEALRVHPDLGDTHLLLLHSRFLPRDRQRIEGEIRRRFGIDGSQDGRWIAVATQVVEVGLDITCDTLHTELAPANAVLQRAGRCARYRGESGDVFVYSSSLDGDGQVIDLTDRVLPYRSQDEEIALTLAELRDRNGQAYTFRDEQEIISAAHGLRDQSVVTGLVATGEMHRRRMNRVMEGQRSGDASNLIRAVSSRLVVVHDDEQSVLERPFSAEAFGLHPGTLRGLVRGWLDREDEMDAEGWAVQALHDMGDVGERGRSTYRWLPVQDVSDVAGSVLVLVHPDLAGYDPDLGFLPDRGTAYRASIASPADQGRPGRYGYRLESYTDHARTVYDAFNRQAWPELSSAAARLERACGWAPGLLARAAHLVVLLHDLGKLNRDWQEWVFRYQRAIGQPAPPGTYAHTDFDPTNPLHARAQAALGRKPPHSVEGAVASAPLLVAATEGVKPVFKAAFSAIARHHGAFTSNYQRYALEPEATAAAAETLAWLPDIMAAGLQARDLLTSENPVRTGVEDLFVDPQDGGQFLAYALLARALRRADQAGTEIGSR